MIDSDKIDDISRLYRLFITVPKGLQCLRVALKDSIVRRGREINNISLGADTVDVDVANRDGIDSPQQKAKPKARATNLGVQPAIKWVQDVLDLKDKFEMVWKIAFQSDRELESSINEVNINFAPVDIFIEWCFFDRPLKPSLTRTRSHQNLFRCLLMIIFGEASKEYVKLGPK